MTAFYAPDPINSTQFIPGGNTPASGGLLFCYQVGSSTKQNTYTDATASTARTNPIVLDSGGNIPGNGEVWIASTAKFVLAPFNDTDPPVSPYWSRDNLPGINDASQTGGEWIASGLTPTFINGSSFIFSGDQTGTFTPGRRLKTLNTGGTRYSTIGTSVFSASTTIGIQSDTIGIDSGLSAISYGLLNPKNTSLPLIVSVLNFGAKGDGVTDDAPAFKAAMAASQSVLIPYSANPYCIGSTLGNEWANKSGCKLYSELGSGPGGVAQSAILKWIGGAAGVMFKGTGLRDSILENFVITIGAAPNTLTTAIDYDPTGETQVMTNNTHNNIWIVARGGATTPDGSIQYGLRISRSTSPGNVSEFTFHNLAIAGTSIAAVSIEHSQSRNHNFYNPNIVWTPIGITNNLNSSTGGSWTIHSGNWGAITDTCMRYGIADDCINVFGSHCETINRFIDATGLSNASINVNGVVCAGSDGLAADGQVIRFGTNVSNGVGAVNITACEFFSFESGGSFKDAKIGYAQASGACFTVSACNFNNTSPFVNNGGGGAQTNFISQGNRGWNGTQYILLPTHGFNNIAKSAVPVSCPADATEDTLATITVRGNTLGKDGLIRITTAWTVTSSINNKTLRVRFSGASGTQYLNTVQTAIDTYRAITDIHNRGATNSQVGGNVASTGGLGGASGGIVTSAVDTTADTTIVITGQKATLGETLTLEAYLVEFIPGF